MSIIEFVGQSARDRDNIAANPSRLVNCYREPVSPGGKTGYSLKSVLGTTEIVDLGEVYTRAMADVDGTLYVCTGQNFYSVSSAGVQTLIGSITDSEAASIAGNNGDVTLVIGGQYRLWDGATFTSPTPGNFSSFGSVEYISNYTVLTQLDGRQFCWSDLADASTLPPLNFTTADGRDDNILRAMQIGGMLYIFKESSHEIWYVTGQANASAFQRQAGGVYDTGLKAFGLICKIDGGAFMVGDDGRAYLVGGGMKPVSIPPVETAIEQCRPKACFTYDDEGHTFCAIVFRDCAAWVFDLATGEWHERAQGSALDPWKVEKTARVGTTWYAGTESTSIRTFGRTNTDNGGVLVREATSLPLYMDGKRFRVAEMELFPRQGFAAATVEISLSRDGGATYGDPKPRDWAVGQYSQRLIWRNQGLARQLVAKVRITDPVEAPINTAARIQVA